METAEFTKDDIRDAVSFNAFTKALAYAREGRVVEVYRRPDGSIESSVRGTERQPYRQRITISAKGKINGHCTCHMTQNCKHVAAALLQLLKGGIQLQLEVEKAEEIPAPFELSPRVAEWLKTLDRAERVDSETYPPEVLERVFYVLSVTSDDVAGQLLVTSVTGRLRKDGTVTSRFNNLDPEIVRLDGSLAHIRPSDRRILKSLATANLGLSAAGYTQHTRVLEGEDGLETLRAMIATGRTHWGTIQGPAVTEGPVVQGRILWHSAEDGSQRPSLACEGDDGAVPFLLAPAGYAHPATGVVGLIALGVKSSIVRAVLRAPVISAAEAAIVRAEIVRKVPEMEGSLPTEVPPPVVVTEKPVPHLRIVTTLLPDASAGWSTSNKRIAAPAAHLSFAYGALEVPFQMQEARPVMLHDGQLFSIQRKQVAEKDFLRRIRRGGLVRASEIYGWDPGNFTNEFVPQSGGQQAWLRFLDLEVPALKAEGWKIEVDADFPFELAAFGDDLAAEIHQGSGIDWFELELGAMVDGQRVDLVGAILKLLDREGPLPSHETLYLQLADGRYLPVPFAKIAPIADALRELFGSGAFSVSNEKLSFSSRDAAALAVLEDASDGVVWSGGDGLRAMGHMLQATTGIPPAPLPRDFVGTLRPYQQQGFDWLQFLGGCGFGGVLADDMGLGKTVQTLVHLLAEKESGRAKHPSLIVCPTSLVSNWRAEAERFTPGLTVLILHGLERKAQFERMNEYDLVISTYPLLPRDEEILLLQRWHVVVLDEAQAIKNPQAQAAQIARKFRAHQRLCLSGTPLENHLGELWSLFAFIAPGFLSDRKEFTRRFRTPIEKQGDTVKRTQLAHRVKPFLLRRTKEDVARDLPPKTEIADHVELVAPQRALYESIRLAMHARVRDAIAQQGLARSQIVILDALLKLRQVCCDPRLLKLETAQKTPSAKLDRLMEILPELLDEGRKVLLFSQFTSMLALIQHELDKAGQPYELLTGDTKDRAKPVERFQSGEVPLFLISLKAGGTGLNLTAADTVILYDPWWNPAVEDQAAGRAHRIGQQNPVFVHKLVALDTIEEKMEGLKAKKRELVRGILDESAGSAFALTESDIENLLSA